MIPHLREMTRVGKSIETQNILVIAKRWERGVLGVTANGYEVSFWSDGNALELDTGDDYVTL